MALNWDKYSDKITAIGATVTALAAISITVIEMRSEQEFQRISVEPYLEMGNSGGAPGFDFYRFVISNTGLGPAVIKSFEFYVDDQEVLAWSDALELLTSGDEEINYSYSSILPMRRISAEETLVAVELTPRSPTVVSFHRAMPGDRVKIELCYCSVYDDCWQSDFSAAFTEGLHQPVRECPIDEDGFSN
ncbi:MAG: hypothetical protein GKR91_05085 [Pseudomonadales bacterium]|nr:hypothetical protein [Pseudomonadales bacterium]